MPTYIMLKDRRFIFQDYTLVMRNTRLSAGALKEFSVDEMQCSSVCTLHGDCVCFTTGGGICRLYSSPTTLETWETEGAEGTMMWFSHCWNTTQNLTHVFPPCIIERRSVTLSEMSKSRKPPETVYMYFYYNIFLLYFSLFL